MNNITEAISIIHNIVELVYELYPDPEFEDEFEEMFGMKSRLAKAQEWIKKQGESK